MMRRLSTITLFVFAMPMLALWPHKALAACTSPAGVESQTIYDFTGHVLKYCDNTSWLTFAAGTVAATQWSNGASGAIYYNGGNVGIGTTSPSAKLDVVGPVQVSGSAVSSVIANSAILSYESGLSASRLIAIGPNSSTSGTLHFTVANTVGGGQSSMVLSSNGNVGIGTQSPAYKLEVAGDFMASGSTIRFPGVAVAGGYYLCLNSATGWGVQVSNGSCTHSDIRLKTDITPLNASEVLAQLQQLRPVSFKWKDQSVEKRIQFGLIAQEVQEVYPNLVSEEDNGLKHLNYEGLIAPLVAAVQELKTANDNLRAEHEAEIRELREEIKVLKAAIH